MPSVSHNGPVNGRGEIPITRLLDNLTELAHAPVRIVVAPAGYGKSTLLRQLADRIDTTGASVPISYPVAAAEGQPQAFVRGLAGAFGPVLGSHATRITQLDTLLDRLRKSDDDFTVLLDDADRLVGRPAVDALTRLLNEAPPNIRFVVATRGSTTPSIGRLTSVRPVHRIDHRDLRLRPWEVELLFRSVYRRPVTPEVAAALCSWTEGWPAALYMVHLDARHGELSGVDHVSWLSPEARDELVGEVLRPVPVSVRDLMVRMSTLGVLSGGLCDAFLDRTDSARLLRKLAETHVLTWPSERDGTCYRFHRLLQLHLEHQLAERLSPAETRACYRRAAGHLARFGHWPEACRAYARAEDWVAVGQVLHHRRADGDGMFDAAIMPKAVLDHDPWLMLARARLFRADGKLGAACRAYTEASSGFDQPGIRWRCATEHAGTTRWLSAADPTDAPLPRADDLSSAVFEAVRHDPGRLLIRPRQTDDPNWRLACALAALLDGRPGRARTLLAESGVGESSFVSLAGRLIATALATVAHRPTGATMVYTTLALEAETAGWPWLARMIRAAAALADPLCCRDALGVRDECRAAGDEWGELVAGILLAMGTIRAGLAARPALRSAIATAHRLGATVPELWLRVLFADELTRTHDPDARDERRVVAAMAEATQVAAHDHAAAFVATLRARTSIATGAIDADPLADPDAPAAPVLIRCLGPYEFLVDGVRLDLSALRPQARLLLRLLSPYTGTGIRDEKLITAIWPDTPSQMARHRLHVALSAVRRLFRGQTGASAIDVVRTEDTYLLRLPEGSQVDLLLFEAAVRRWRANGGTTGADRAVEFGLQALRWYRGDLLCADQGADGCVLERDRLRTEASTVATMLATHALDRGDIATGIRLCRRGLQIDELNEQLWQLMAQAQRRTGNEAAARRALRTYADLFGEPAIRGRTIPSR